MPAATAANQRAIATAEIWLVMPCPVSRSAKITSGSSQTVENAIDRQASARSTSTPEPKTRARNRSVRPPAQTMTAADSVVPSE